MRSSSENVRDAFAIVRRTSTTIRLATLAREPALVHARQGHDARMTVASRLASDQSMNVSPHDRSLPWGLAALESFACIDPAVKRSKARNLRWELGWVRGMGLHVDTTAHFFPEL